MPKTYRTERFEGFIELESGAVGQLEESGVNVASLQHAIAEEGRFSCERQSDDDDFRCALIAEYAESKHGSEPSATASFICSRILRQDDRRYPHCPDHKKADECRKELTKAILPHLELPETEN